MTACGCDCADMWPSRTGELPPELSCESLVLADSLDPLVAASPVAMTLFTFLDARRVGRKVHLRFRCAHRLHGNFLSHFVFVLAQLLHAMGVRPADLGMMPAFGGRPSWLFASRPWTV
jgi:hypothetical protein